MGWPLVCRRSVAMFCKDRSEQKHTLRNAERLIIILIIRYCNYTHTTQKHLYTVKSCRPKLTLTLLSAFHCFVPRNDCLVKLHHEGCAFVAVGCHFGGLQDTSEVLLCALLFKVNARNGNLFSNSLS